MRNPRILVVDRSDDLVSQIGHVVDRLRPRPDITVCAKVATFDDVIDQDGPFDVLLAGPALANRSGLGRLALIHSECPGLSIILAFAERPNANLREVVRTGAVDLLPLPVDDTVLLETVERAIDMSRMVPDDAGGKAVGTEGAGTVLTVTSASGGCGKTFLATNLAYFLRSRTAKRTAVLDLDLQFGEVPTALRVRPRYTIVDLLEDGEAEESDLGDQLEQYLVEHDLGIQVLAAPKDPSDADRVDVADVIRVVQALRSRFDYVVIDTPPKLNETVLAALDLSDHIYVMATLDLPSIRNLGLYLSTLDKLKIAPGHLQLVLNKKERDLGIDVDQVVKLYERPFSMVLPHVREVSKSLNLGVPMLAYLPDHEISRCLSAGLSSLVDGPAATDPRPAPTAERSAPRGLLSRLRRPPSVAEGTSR